MFAVMWPTPTHTQYNHDIWAQALIQSVWPNIILKKPTVLRDPVRYTILPEVTRTIIRWLMHHASDKLLLWRRATRKMQGMHT